jgi:hypothetical protein
MKTSDACATWYGAGSLLVAFVGAALLVPAAGSGQSTPQTAVSLAAAEKLSARFDRDCIHSKPGLIVTPGLGYRRHDTVTGATISTPRILAPGAHRKVNVRFSKKYTICGAAVTQERSRKYFPPTTRSTSAQGKVILTGTGAFLVDPYPNQVGDGRSLGSMVVWLRTKKT